MGIGRVASPASSSFPSLTSSSGFVGLLLRFASSSATEILTRSKSQIQRDRSLRTAPAVNNSPSLTGKIVSKITRTYPRATIKDLRLRRVFSPSSISSSDWGFKTKGDEYPPRESHDSNKTEGFVQTTPPNLESLSSGLITESAVKKNGTNLCSKSVLLHPCSRAKIFKNHGSFNSYGNTSPLKKVVASSPNKKPGKVLKEEKSKNGEETCTKVSNRVRRWWKGLKSSSSTKAKYEL